MTPPAIAFPSAFSPSKVVIADLFCGAGGTSAGAVEAVMALGRTPEVTAVNHWPIAIDTHTANHPGARHFCTGIDSVNPRHLFGENELDILWASPECTHHSIARGGKPINDQSRATAWCVIRWAEALRPPIILIENVPEFQTWGPIGSTGRPLPSKKGETFQAWLSALRSLGYKVDHQMLCAADYGDPTTRTRLFIQAVRGRRKIVWPAKTHTKTPELFTTRRWTPARDIIDWSLSGGSIYERPKPLSEKTMARIFAGLRKFGLKEFIIPQNSSNNPVSLESPCPTLTTTSRGVGFAQPFIIPNFGEREGQSPRVHDIESPLPTVTSHGAGALITSYIVAWDHTSGGPGAGISSIEEPISTVVTKARHGLAEPFLIELRGSSASNIRSTARSIESPLPTITATGTHNAVIQPYLCNLKGQSTACDIQAPIPTITAHAPHLYLAEPYLIKTANGTSRAGEHSRAMSLQNPAPTICGNRGDLAIIQPHLLPQQSAGALRPVSDPTPTVSTSGAIALVEPLLLNYQAAAGAGSTERPIVEINGIRYLLDIRFRMLQPHELALAQGFPANYKFTGNKSEQVKQIGNAVPRRLARAILAAVLTQSQDVSWLVDAEESQLFPAA
jgi:DNA (cytosine-5)-methyltransferase 1